METTIKNGDSIMVSSIFYLFSKPKIGDIVVFKRNGKVFIKRITKIDPSADGDKYFVKGDNERDSMDSRRLGWIGRREIMGKVIHKISNVKNQISNLHLKSQSFGRKRFKI